MTMLVELHLLLLTLFPFNINESTDQMSQNLILRNANVVTVERRFINDIRIAKGKIVEIGKTIQKDDESTISPPNPEAAN